MVGLRNCMRAAAVLSGIAALQLSATVALAQKKGGDIVMAQQAQPPTLDGMTTSAQATRTEAPRQSVRPEDGSRALRQRSCPVVTGSHTRTSWSIH